MTRIARISLTTPDADRLASFYELAFGFTRIASAQLGGRKFETLMQVQGGAKTISLRLGAETIELLEFESPGQPYPADFSSSSLLFQHFAIVTQNTGEVYRRLSEVGGWSAITDREPQRLPQSSGGVTAFKFRDPDGHPLELLEFPKANVPEYWRRPGQPMPCQGIDHSAISVADTERSVAFYAKLGFRRVSCSVNSGIKQARLDHIEDVHVVVTALASFNAAPHLELLCYVPDGPKEQASLRNNDVAATALVMEGVEGEPKSPDTLDARIVVDPDGHRSRIIL
jgi:catechol 2,3-dioxygenase-like lactoylglutathione lyase family enzyme